MASFDLLEGDVYDALSSDHIVIGRASLEYGTPVKNDERSGSNKNTKRSPWMPDIHLKKKFLVGNNNHNNTNCPTLQEKCKLLRELCCSPEKNKIKKSRPGGRFSLTGNHKGTRHEDDEPQQQQVQDDPNSSDIEKVYENVEILLDALRKERHQEKLRAECEIQSLKEKIEMLEGSKNDVNTEKDFSTTTRDDTDITDSTAVNEEITESIFETLAILENECEEWQQAKTKATATTIGKQHHRQQSEEETLKIEKKIIESVKSLRTKEFVPEKDRKLLSWYFSPRHGDESRNSLNHDHDHEKIENLQEKLQMLEQQLEEKDLEMNLERKELKQLILQKENDLGEMASTYHGAMIMVETKQYQLDKNDNDDDYSMDQEDKENDKSHPGELHKTEGKNLEEKMKRQMQELQDKLNNHQCQLLGAQRKKHSDVLMKLAVESTHKASLAMKLDTALAQIEKQKETISFLQQELSHAKYDCRLMFEQSVQEGGTTVSN